MQLQSNLQRSKTVIGNVGQISSHLDECSSCLYTKLPSTATVQSYMYVHGIRQVQNSKQKQLPDSPGEIFFLDSEMCFSRMITPFSHAWHVFPSSNQDILLQFLWDGQAAMPAIFVAAKRE